MACPIDLEFNNGLKMPTLGIGTWRAPDDEIETALDLALEAGYRHIDTAPVYMNEKVIGNVLKKWFDSGKLSREEIFICTKLPPQGNRADTVEKYLRASLEDLQLDYVDLYLIHTPFALPDTDGAFLRDENGEVLLDLDSNHIETWKKMEEMVENGLAKTIGVSNFNERQIQNLLDNSTIKPANLQIEVHLYFQQVPLVDFCKENDIIVTAYSPLGSKGIEQLLLSAGIEREVPDLMENVDVITIAERLNKTPAQILLRHIIERGIAVIPKSTNPDRLKQNIDIFDFELSEDDKTVLDSFAQEGIRVCDFAFFKGVTKHPEFPW